MIWFLVVLCVLAMGGVALVASGRGTPMADAYDDRPDALVPTTGDLGPQHLRRVRFSLAARGYRMSEVDALLARLAAQLEAHEAWQPPAEAPADAPTDPPVDPLAKDDQSEVVRPESRGDALPPG